MDFLYQTKQHDTREGTLWCAALSATSAHRTATPLPPKRHAAPPVTSVSEKCLHSGRTNWAAQSSLSGRSLPCHQNHTAHTVSGSAVSEARALQRGAQAAQCRRVSPRGAGRAAPAPAPLLPRASPRSSGASGRRAESCSAESAGGEGRSGADGGGPGLPPLVGAGAASSPPRFSSRCRRERRAALRAGGGGGGEDSARARGN